MKAETVKVAAAGLPPTSVGAHKATLAVGMCSTKGGAGKTTLAFNLAERASWAGLNVALLDFDPQEGSIGLADLRDGPPSWDIYPSRVSVEGAQEFARVRDAGRYDLLLCDFPGQDSLSLGRLLADMKVVLAPICAGPSDLMAAANFHWMVSRMTTPVYFLPNCLPRGKSRLLRLLAELDYMGATVCPAVLMRRVAYLDSLRRGLGVCEYLPGSEAAREVQALWQWLASYLELETEVSGS